MGVKLFQHANCGGNNEHFDEGFYNLTDGDNIWGSIWDVPNIQNDELSSYILDPLTSVTFYQHIDKGGNFFEDHNDSNIEEKRVNYIGNDWNDSVSSIVVEPVFPSFGSQPPPLDTDPNLTGVLVFEDWKYNQTSDRSLGIFARARSQKFDVGEYPILPNESALTLRRGTILRLGVRSNMISSLRIGTGYYIELYEKQNFAGEMLTIRESTDDIRVLRKEHYSATEVNEAKNWNDRTMSLKVMKYPLIR